MEDSRLALYSPIQVDIIDRDNPGPSFPLQAAGPEHLDRIMNVLWSLQSQEDARNAFTAPEQDWSEICEKIISVTRTTALIDGQPYGVYFCQSKGDLAPKEVDDLRWYCRNEWENGWGEGYAHCPSEGPGLGLYIHFWQDDSAPLLTREQLEAVQKAEQCRPAIKEITPDTFWTLLAQAKNVCGNDQKAAAYWLTERLLELDPEQVLNFHSITHGYLELADKYGLWNAAILLQEDDCNNCGFEDFRVWLIYQGKETYLAALRDPDSLADLADCVSFQFEALPYVGDMAHERLTGRTAYADISPDAQKRLTSELKKGIVYGAGIEFPHEWSEVASYLPRLTAQCLTPSELRSNISRGHLWNHNDPDIRRARAIMPRKKKTRSPKKKEGDAR